MMISLLLVDPSQVYSCDLTIGAVGLSEIRLCHKSESYDSFNSDEIIKLHRSTLIRESLSSSEFSSRNSKHTTKTTSPYSSTNSLNSMDSSAFSYGRTPKLPSSTQPKMSAPPRKKRAAPKPPSQAVIPEKAPLIMENGNSSGVGEKEAQQVANKSAGESPLNNKDFSLSTPNLTSSTMLVSDINGNDCNGHLEDLHEVSSGNGSLNSNGYAEDTVLYAQVQKKNALNVMSQNKQDIRELPEPSPRKRIVQIKKKTVAPPAPPPRNSLYQEDAVSIASTNVSSTSTPTTPMGLSKSMDSFLDQEEEEEQHKEHKPIPLERSEAYSTPKPVPRITTSSTLLNATDLEQDLKNFESDCSETTKSKTNVSKVMLNRTPTPEPRSLSCEPPEIDHCYETQLEHFKQQTPEDDCVSKQADSGIGEPVPSPIPDSLNSNVSTLDVKSNFESSSDDDDMVKVYNFKLGKTLVKPVKETKSLEELTVMTATGQEETDSEIGTPLTLTQVNTPNTLSETSSWNFVQPISPPPNFADNKFVDNLEQETLNKPDTPITPKILERPVLNFEVLKQEQENMQEKEVEEEKRERTLLTPLDNIVDELSAIIQDKGVDSLMKKSEEQPEIESAKPNTLSNFTINSIQQNQTSKPKEVLNATENPLEIETDKPDFIKSSSPLSSPSTTPDEEKLYRKRSSITSLKQRRSVTRSDSFHTTAACHDSMGLNKRTSSQLSLDQMAGNLNRRRSSSELSIGESPSLQSLEVIKTILNSRKNSLANSSGGEEERNIEVSARRPSEELKFASLELKTGKTLEKQENKEREEGEEKQQEKPEEVGKDEKQEVQEKQDQSLDNIENKEKTAVKEDKPKELPKVYRYSGPPSINFSTWSERPKSQVAIKNEGDYIFGGGNKNNRMSTTVSNQNEPPPVAPKPATIQRMGIPEKEYKVPVLVKPIQDVIVDKVPVMEERKEEKLEETKNPEPLSPKPQQNGFMPNKPLTNQRPTVETILRPKNQVFVTSNLSARNSQRPTVEAVLRPQTQVIVNTSTLPRANKQRFSTPASTAAGPQLLRSSSIKQQQQPEVENKEKLPGPQILRSSSIKQQQPDNTNHSEAPSAPFGQNTLRRTGLKEKILAKEEENQQKAIINTPSSTSSTPTPLQNGDVKLTNQKYNNTITSAKLHLNLKQSHNTSVTTITSNHLSQPKTTSPSFSTINPALKPKPLTPKTAPVQTFSNQNTFSVQASTPNPPPPPPPTPSIQLKPIQQQQRTPTSTDGDPRDALLAAIRNFNKEGLKKA